MSAEVNSPQEGLQVLVNAVKVAVKRGAFELEEVETILKAIKAFAVQTVEDVKEDLNPKEKAKS